MFTEETLKHATKQQQGTNLNKLSPEGPLEHIETNNVGISQPHTINSQEMSSSGYETKEQMANLIIPQYVSVRTVS